MIKATTEAALEATIESHLLTPEAGYHRGDPTSFDTTLALIPTELLAALERTQPKTWSHLQSIHGPALPAKALAEFDAATAAHGLLHILRHGFRVHGRPLRLVTFAPPNRLNPTQLTKYAANRLLVVRQLHHVAPADDQVPAPLPRSLRKHVSERADHVAGGLGGVWCRIPHVRNVLQATSQPRLAQGRARAKHPAQGEPTVPDPRRALDRRGATPRRGGGV